MDHESRPIRIAIAAGGTGGHLYPAVALAREFKRQGPGSDVLFIGVGRGIEAKVLAHEGFPLKVVTARPVMGGGLARSIGGLLSLPQGFWQALKVLRSYRADIVIGIGGYASPAVVLAAACLRIPRAILEPNAYPGAANRMLGPFANRVFLAFDSSRGAFPAAKVRVVGSPIRREFLAPAGDRRTEAAGRPLVLLVFGGSQGSRAINEAMVDALPNLKDVRDRLQIVHQTGDTDHDPVLAGYRKAGFRAEVVPFLFDMPERLRSADLVISRSGAMTLAELTVCGRPAILIPLPHAIYDHQLRNAEVLEAAGAAVVVNQAELGGQRLASVIGDLIGNPGRLAQMGERSRELGRTDSAEAIVRECVALVAQARGERHVD